METVKLNNGIDIPVLGIGTFTLSPEQAENAVQNALEDGYRLIDTANAYMNEKAVGRAMHASSIPREEIFLSTKLWPSVYKKKDAIDKTLTRLNTDCIDLLFLHQPSPGWKEAYRMLENAYRQGKIRAIGISNFTVKNISELLTFAEIMPQVIQLENHPYYTAVKERAALKETGMRVMAWYPLGHGDRRMLDEPVFTRLGQKYGKSSAQMILRWHIQYGNIIIPGSANPAHIRENADIFDFELSDEEMNEISRLDKNKPYFHANPVITAAFSLMKMNFDHQK